MSKNGYLEKQAAMREGYFLAGLYAGRQQMIDMISLVLRDSEYVGKNTFGRDRLLKIINGIGAYLDRYEKAWQRDTETDYYRDKLDAALEEAYGEELHDSFLKRYEFAPEFDYTKGKWRNG